MKRDPKSWQVTLQMPLLFSFTIGALILISVAANFLLIPTVILMWFIAKIFGASSGGETSLTPEKS